MRAAVVCAVLAACGGGDPKVPATVIALADPGAAPRRALVYQPKAVKRAARIIVQQPGLVMAVDWKLTSSSRTAPIRYGFELTGVKFDFDDGDTLVEDMMMKLEPGVAVGDEHGRVAAKILGAHNTAPSIPVVLMTVIVPLPSEPIGVGAKWIVRGDGFGDPGAKAVTDYQLTALAADGGTVTAHRTTTLDGKAVAEETSTMQIRFDDLLPVQTDLRARMLVHDDVWIPMELRVQ
jgi:hypothetical protein